MELKILQPHEIQQPRHPFLVAEQNEKDWILGAQQGATFVKENLFPDRDCVPFITEFNDLQRNNNFDQFCCVIHATINNAQLLVKRKYNITLDLSKRDLALKTGVVPNQGTSIRAGSETLRTQGCSLEKDYPSMTPTMTQKEFFTPLQGVKEFFLANGYEYNHINLPSGWLGAKMEDIIDDGLKSSGVIVAIEGSYHFDGEGRLQFAGSQYLHVVLVVKSLPDCFLVLDSENPQGLMKVRRDYNFSSPKIASVNKKFMKLIKKIGQPAICFKHWSEPVLIAFGDGAIPGGDLFKSLFGVEKYSDLPREDVAEWPYPIKYVMNTSNFNLSNIE